MRTPLAWKNLTGNPKRLALGAAGVSFAAVLMFMQNGFRFALLESPVQVLDVMSGDLIAASSTRFAVAAEQRFDEQLLTRATGDPDVVWVEPVYVERTLAQIRVEKNRKRSIRVIGVPTQPHAIKNSRLKELLDHIQRPGTALVDRRSKSQYGFAFDDPMRLFSQRVELAGQKLKITGIIDLGTDFAHDGNLVVSTQTMARLFPFRSQISPHANVDFGLIGIRDGADPNVVASRLTALAPRSWTVKSREDLIQSEKDFWGKQTPIGKIFFVGTLMGFAVGVIICYQILYTNIQDSMSELATLKAMGYNDRFFVQLVVRQSVYISIIGFVPSILISWVLFQGLREFSGLPIFMTPSRILLVFGLTLVMCILSGLLALRKLIRADPASLF